MRAVEAKYILDKIINEDKQVVVESQPGFNNSLFSISKIDDYVEFLYLISDLSFSDVKREEIEQLDFIKNRRDNLNQEELNLLNSLINRSNSNLRVVYSTVDFFAEEQDSKLINIKIPENIKTLEDLSYFNKKIENIFKIFDYGNDKNNYTFSGVDKGTAWIEIIINNINLHIDFTLSLHLALYFVENWNGYKNTPSFNINLNIFLSEDNGKNEKDYLEKYRDVFFEAELKKREFQDDNNLNGRFENEKITSIMKGAKSIIAIMEEGSELRISYNPPNYIKDSKNFFEIDYKKLPKIEPKIVEKKKKEELDSPKIQKNENE